MIPASFLRCLASAALIGGLTSACTTSNSNPINVGYLGSGPTNYASTVPGQPGQPIGGAVQSAVLLPAGNYTLTTVRERPPEGNVPRVLCQAPSPDWATALAMQAQLQGSANILGGGSGSLAASGSTAETISTMAGRTAGVAALRDGLYNVCQAYANGVIGKDAYALALSTYSYLLVALAGSNGSSSSAGGGTTSEKNSSTSSIPAGVAVAVNTVAAAPASSTGGQSQQTKGSDATGSQASAALVQLQIVHALATACISANDPSVSTLDAHGARLVNPLLDARQSTFCQTLIATIGASAKGGMTPTNLGASGPPAGNKTAGASPADPIVKAVQAALKKAGDCQTCRTLDDDGIAGTQTVLAVMEFQGSNRMEINGNPKDPKLLLALKISSP